MLEEILEKVPEMFNMAEIMAKAAEKTPYVVVAFQECERMNILTNEMRRSLKELSLGLKVIPCRPAGTQGRHSGGRRAPQADSPPQRPNAEPWTGAVSVVPLLWLPWVPRCGPARPGCTPRLGVELLSRTPSMAGVGEARRGAGWAREWHSPGPQRPIHGSLRGN